MLKLMELIEKAKYIAMVMLLFAVIKFLQDTEFPGIVYPKENSKSYNINILSKYSKTITNKDDSGNPKNYNIKAKVEIKYFAKEENEKNETFERSINLSAQNKKITEKEMENKYKKDLSNLLSQDIVFLLKNQ